MPVEFQLERFLRVGQSSQRRKWNREIAIATGTDTLGGNLANPLDDP